MTSEEQREPDSGDPSDGGPSDDGPVEVEAHVDIVNESDNGSASPPDPPTDGDPPPPVDPRATGTDLPKDTRQTAMFIHLLGLAHYAFPFGGIVGPLVLWQMKREEHPFLDQQGRSAVNFNITAGIAVIVTMPVMLVTCIPLPVLISVAASVFSILAALAANDGKSYDYPFSLQLVK